MKILQVIAAGPMAGAEKSVLASTLALQDIGCSPVLLVISEGRKPQCAEAFIAEARKNKLDIMTIKSRGRIDPMLWFQMRSLLAARRYDIVHAHGYKALTYLAPLKGYTSALVATYHGATSHTLLSRFFERIELYFFEKVDRLFVVSEGALADLRKKGLKTVLVAVIPNIVPASFVKELSEKKASTGSELQLLYLGRLSKEKGLDVLISALELLPKLPFQLQVVGDGPERNAIRDQIQKAGLEDKIRLAGFQAEVATYLRKADALIMPSRTEGMPMALIEAAVSGLPVVASLVGGIGEIVTHGQNGLLVEPDHPIQLAQAIEVLYKKWPHYRDTSQKLVIDMQERFCSESCSARILAEYRRVLDEKHDPSI